MGYNVKKINSCIIIGNGKVPTKQILSFYLKRKTYTIICADGGANSAKKLGIIPDYIIGDLDSITPATLKYFSNKSIIKKIIRQNDTDIEKCLKFAITKKFDEALLLGVTGDRLDHTICNLGIVIKFFNKIRLSIVSEKSFLAAYNSDISFRSKQGETISIYAFDKKTKITSSGLKYKLTKTALPFGLKESTSNVANSEMIKLKISGGIIFVIRDFNFMKKYDLF